ncbi:MAG: topoisomerase DNA-binding C4 zinc finger domain-containing protein [Deltaproteobacteria bacterium]|nr:topoisomerase DNA-binding C4 zinc finger domain-containing protein [Deltaproteobacteria bacterium]
MKSNAINSVALTPPQQPPVAEGNDNHVCPKCSAMMVLRVAKTGKNIGKKFWGCSNYPKCRMMFPYEKSS